MMNLQTPANEQALEDFKGSYNVTVDGDILTVETELKYDNAEDNSTQTKMVVKDMLEGLNSSPYEKMYVIAKVREGSKNKFMSSESRKEYMKIFDHPKVVMVVLVQSDMITSIIAKSLARLSGFYERFKVAGSIEDAKEKIRVDKEKS